MLDPWLDLIQGRLLDSQKHDHQVEEMDFFLDVVPFEYGPDLIVQFAFSVFTEHADMHAPEESLRRDHEQRWDLVWTLPAFLRELEQQVEGSGHSDCRFVLCTVDRSIQSIFGFVNAEWVDWYQIKLVLR